MLFKMYNGEEGMDREGKRGEAVDLYVVSTRRHFCDTQYKYKDNYTLYLCPRFECKLNPEF